MTVTLTEARRAFLAGVRKHKMGAANFAIIEAVIDDLIAWSQHPARRLQFEPPAERDGSQPTLGFRLAGPNRALVWNAFPRQKDGAKIDIASRKSGSFSEAKRASMREFVATIPGGETRSVPMVPVVSLRDADLRQGFKRALDDLLGIDAASLSSAVDTAGSGGGASRHAALAPSASEEEPPEVRRQGYKKEFMGVAAVSTPHQPQLAAHRHGAVVEALHRQLESQQWITSNDDQRDLMVARAEGPARILFEVKTSIDRQDIYTGVGQLLLNGPDSPGLPLKRVLVLPATPEATMLNALKRLRIAVVHYSFNDESVSAETVAFDGLSDALDTADT